MYALELRRRVSGLFYVDGLSRAAIMGVLAGELGDGAPCLETVRRWLRADPRHGAAGRRRPSYTLEDRMRAVRMSSAGASDRVVAAAVGCSASSVRNWVRACGEEAGMERDEGRGMDAPAVAPAADVGDDVAALRRQVEALRLENAVMRETIRVLKAAGPRPDPAALTSGERTRAVRGAAR